MLADAAILVFAPLIVLAAYLVFRVAGFGSTLGAVLTLAARCCCAHYEKWNRR